MADFDPFDPGGAGRVQRYPDSDHRLHRADGEMSGRPRRSPATLILGAIAAVLIVVFVILVATSGDGGDDPAGDGAATLLASASAAST